MNNISSLLDFLSINKEDVEDITSSTSTNGDTILVTLKKKDCFCPYCKSSYYRLKEYRKRIIKHSLFLGKETTFVLRNRKYKCNECDRSFMEPNNFAPKKSRVSYETIHTILDTAKNYNSTWVEIAKKAHISDTAAIHIFDRFVNLPRGSLPRVLSIDECYNKHQFNEPYSCIFFDFFKHQNHRCNRR